MSKIAVANTSTCSTILATTGVTEDVPTGGLEAVGTATGAATVLASTLSLSKLTPLVS